MHPALVSFPSLLRTHPCIPTCTHKHTHPPKALKISLRLWPAGAHGYMSKPHFLLSSGKQRGVESKAENTWHLSPLGAAREEGRPGFGEGGGVLKHLVSVWQRRGNCYYWTARQAYIVVCVLTPGKIPSFYNLGLIFFILPSFPAVMIAFFYHSHFTDKQIRCCLTVLCRRPWGIANKSHQTTINFCFKTCLCETFCTKL